MILGFVLKAPVQTAIIYVVVLTAILFGLFVFIVNINRSLKARTRLVRKFQEIEAVNWRTAVLPEKIKLARDEKRVYDRLIDNGTIDKHYSDNRGKDVIRVWLDAERIDAHIAKTRKVLIALFSSIGAIVLFLIIAAAIDVFAI
ncbi:MAG: hypothetical protein ACFFDI_30265 [Promethearchaeota archaeon]